MSAAPAPNAVFVFGSQNPVDLLSNASCVCRFLAEVSPIFADNRQTGGLSEHGVDGLGMILHAVENTINEAMLGL